jgi:hypothetical protein
VLGPPSGAPHSRRCKVRFLLHSERARSRHATVRRKAPGGDRSPLSTVSNCVLRSEYLSVGTRPNCPIFGTLAAHFRTSRSRRYTGGQFSGHFLCQGSIDSLSPESSPLRGFVHVAPQRLIPAGGISSVFTKTRARLADTKEPRSEHFSEQRCRSHWSDRTASPTQAGYRRATLCGVRRPT